MATKKKTTTKIKHVFIDTNVFLNLFRRGEDNGIIFDNLIKNIQSKKIKLYLTNQVVLEFYRNRDSVVQDYLNRLKEQKVKFKFNALPFDSDHELVVIIEEQSKSIRDLIDKMYSDFLNDAKNKNLYIDNLFNDLITNASVINASDGIVEKAHKRFLKGNPPRKDKDNSIGDAINWELLLLEVPNKSDLYIISDDKDFTTKIGEDVIINTYLRNEWLKIKKANIFHYKAVASFLKKELKDKNISKKQIDAESVKSILIPLPNSKTHEVISKIKNVLDKSDEGSTSVSLMYNGQKMLTSYNIDVTSDILNSISDLGVSIYRE